VVAVSVPAVAVAVAVASVVVSEGSGPQAASRGSEARVKKIKRMGDG
jgi:hypothetical protein